MGVFQKLKTTAIEIGSSRTFQGAVALFSARSLNSFISLLFSLLAGRILTVEDHGLFSQTLARIVIVQAITEAGLQYSLVRFLSPRIAAGDDSGVRAIVRASLQIKLYALLPVVALSLFALGGVFGSPFLGSFGVPAWLLPGSEPDLLVVFWIILLGGFGMSLFSYLDAILVAHTLYLRLSFWLPSVGLIRLALLGALLLSGEGMRAEHVLFAFTLGPYIAVAVYFLFFPATFFLRQAAQSDWHGWMSKLFRYNLWIVAASFMSILSDWMEILMIRGAADAGLYNAARMPMQGFLILLATMQSILLPRFSALTTRSEFSAAFRRVYLLVVPGLVLLIPGFWVFDWFIPAWYGPDYLPSTRVFLILYPNFMLRLLFAPLGTALFALDQPRLIGIETGIKMVVGFVANLVLIPEYGLTGAALASWVAQVSGWIFLSFCFLRYFRTGAFPLDNGNAETGSN